MKGTGAVVGQGRGKQHASPQGGWRGNAYEMDTLFDISHEAYTAAVVAFDDVGWAGNLVKEEQTV